ncbi:hypothetical protein NitaMp116 (mitochondrion) [Nicotiana tabacum]|uniref:Uncharacterized protein n=1 Tax=Nicotiana tabacum TaxID=4097 RepID=Q5M9V9_TOBAC|nr:hypothetical protein NitaMp116 [Nicotiana tabacum]BAD83519.1 hypothetical protein [Nicotiana tabacum]
MNNRSFRLYGDPTPSDLHFMQSSTSSFPSASSTSSTRSDAQSAPPELTQLFDGICQKSAELLRLRGRELPPEWNIADLIQAVMGDEAFLIPGHLQDTYYDVLLRGCSSWLLEDLFHFLDLINYVF